MQVHRYTSIVTQLYAVQMLLILLLLQLQPPLHRIESTAKCLHRGGCHQHLRCIGTGAGHAEVEKYILSLLKEDVENAKNRGVRCVTGQQIMSLRTLFVGLLYH